MKKIRGSETKRIARARIRKFLDNKILINNLFTKVSSEKNIYKFIRQLRYEKIISSKEFIYINKLLKSKDSDSFILGRSIIEQRVRENYTLGFSRRFNKRFKVIRKK